MIFFVLYLVGYLLRACLGELQVAPDPKKQLHSKFFLPNTPSSSSSTADLLQEKGGARPKSMDLVEYLLRHSTKQNLVELGEITHHCH
jgi:hypothetical protein